MAGNRTGRTHADCADCISAAGRTCWKNSTQDICHQVLLGRNIAVGFVVFQSPLLFCSINLAEIVDALIAGGRRIRLLDHRACLLYRRMCLLVFDRQPLQLILLLLGCGEDRLQLLG